MGKQKHQQRRRHGRHNHHTQEEEDVLPSSAFDIPVTASVPPMPIPDIIAVEDTACFEALSEPNKHELYQRSVQSPKGDISYLQKFFLSYIGGRSPLHLREDFCGTALICAEWLRGGAQRIATALDLDADALTWGLQHNIEKLGIDACSRVHLFHGNVLEPISEARLLRSTPFTSEYVVKTGRTPTSLKVEVSTDIPACQGGEEAGCNQREHDESTRNDESNCAFALKDSWPGADIVCGLNYSCCCLHKRSDLVSYFKLVLKGISDKGGIFVMDIYGGRSSECALKLHRQFGDFTYIWEQEEFDIVTRTTRISLHFRLKNNRMLRHAFTYYWRLWSLPELRDCLEEAGFKYVHFWMRSMPNLRGGGEDQEIEDDESKYEEANSYIQADAWNAYIVAVSHKRPCD